MVTVQETSEFFKNSEVSYSSLALQRPQSRVYFWVWGGVGIVFPCKISVIAVPLWRKMDNQLNGYEMPNPDKPEPNRLTPSRQETPNIYGVTLP